MHLDQSSAHILKTIDRVWVSDECCPPEFLVDGGASEFYTFMVKIILRWTGKKCGNWMCACRMPLSWSGRFWWPILKIWLGFIWILLLLHFSRSLYSLPIYFFNTACLFFSTCTSNAGGQLFQTHLRGSKIMMIFNSTDSDLTSIYEFGPLVFHSFSF